MTIALVVQQHADEAAALRGTRACLVRAPHAGLLQLRRLDERIAAHLDGLAVAGAPGLRLAAAALARPGRGEVFAAAVRFIEEGDAASLDKVMALAEAVPEGRAGLLSAFGWVPAASLRGIAARLLASAHSFRREAGLAACAMQRVDPGSPVALALNDRDPALRARALRVSADGARVDLLEACLGAMPDEDPRCAFEAARASVLLGDRHKGTAALRGIAMQPGPWRWSALDMVLKLLASAEALALLGAVSREPGAMRLLIRGAGMAGDACCVSWLLEHMHDAKLARLAGESFSMITGLDLSGFELASTPPDDEGPGSSADPEDERVAMDEDEGLPWPDPQRVLVWWHDNGHRFAAGQRLFMGEAPHAAHCMRVLRTGRQRQRAAAAAYLCLLQPGTPLFPTHAPAWRQAQWLDAMGTEGAGP